MTIHYNIDENDFLTNQLFLASKSDRIKKKRKRNKIVVPLVYGAFALLFLLVGNFFLSFMFLIVGLLWFLIYPAWEKRYYLKHYQGFIKENYSNRFGKTGTIAFANDFITAKDDGSESKILTTEIQEINEIPSAVYIRLKGGQSFVLPKTKITDLDNVVNWLKKLAVDLNIKYEIDEKWEWK